MKKGFEKRIDDLQNEAESLKFEKAKITMDLKNKLSKETECKILLLNKLSAFVKWKKYNT